MALYFKKSNFFKFNIYNNNNDIKNYKISLHNNSFQNIKVCNCTEIKELSQIKYLELIYDNKLNRKFNIERINNIIRKSFVIFKILGQILDIKLLRSV